MEVALKQEAETFFHSNPDFQKAHLECVTVSQAQRFYMLLLSKYLPTNELTSKIVTLHTAKTIRWPELINAIWALSLSLSQDSPLFKTLAQFVSEIDRKNIVDRNPLMTLLPQNLIDAANLQKKQALERRAQRAYTKFYYDQKKHNLLRESNEGYARLCLLLASMTPRNDNELVWNQILSLIGNFDLDPDRVLDLLIESYVQSANTQICLNLIKNFNPQSIVALIGNRILKNCTPQQSEVLIYAGKVQNFLTGNGQQIHTDLEFSPNPRLIRLACFLIKTSFIQLDSLFPYLSPADTVFEREQSKRLLNGKQKILKSFKLLMQQLTPQQQFKIKQEENLKFYGQLLNSSKLAVFSTMIQINDWRNFISKFWNVYGTGNQSLSKTEQSNGQKIDLIIYQPMLRQLLNMLEWVIDPLNSKISLNRFFKLNNYMLHIKFPTSDQTEMDQEARIQMTQCKNLEEPQFKKIVELFDIIKIYIGFHSRLYIKVCRIFTAIIKDASLFSPFNNPVPTEMQPEHSTHTLAQYISSQIERIIRMYLLPGMSLQTGNSALTKQLYTLLEQFDYRFRYRCYLYHYSEGMIMNPCLSHIFFKTRNKQIVIVNNLSDKNKKIFMRKMAKLTHNQAMQTFYWIFRRILMEDYEKVVPQIVGVLAGSCALTLEMTVFMALHILNEQKEPAMNFKTGEQAPWFKNLINYISLFYRKYLEIDIQPVFDYIIMKIGQDVTELENNQQLPGGLIGLLHELLSKMFCNFVLKEVNKNKLEMLSVGPCLQLEAMDISSEIKASKKSKLILQKFFWGKSVDQYDGQSLAISLLVLLTQKRAQVLHKSYISNMSILGGIYDDYTTLIIQLIRVLNELSTDYKQYSKLLPQNSLSLLINQYKLPLQIAFEIYRPSIKHISTMASEEWTQFYNYIGSVMKEFVNSKQKYITGYSQNQKMEAYLNENYTKMNNFMSNQFFTTFWMLTLDSIYFPTKIYAEKIEEVKKKAQTKVTRGRNDKPDRQIEKAKTLYQSLKTEELNQSKKVQDTTNDTNLARLKVDLFQSSGGSKDDKSSSLAIQQFAEIFVQICLLPRMMLDPEQALYCVKITFEVIKINKVTSAKSVKLLIFIIEHVMNSLPYATEREASYCLAIFLSEIMNVIVNWNDQLKLKQDMKKWLGIDEQFVEQNFQRLKKQFIKLYVRFGNIVKSIKDEPYNIKNCLYLLQKVDIIPAYKKQAEDLENHLKMLKQKYSLTLQTIIDMQLSIIGQKKKSLPIIQDDGQPPVNTIRADMPTFSNLSVDQKMSSPPAVSPMRSPIRATDPQKPAKIDKKQIQQTQKNKYKSKDQERQKFNKQKERERKYEKQVDKSVQIIVQKPQVPIAQNIITQKKPVYVEKISQNATDKIKPQSQPLPEVADDSSSIKQIVFAREATFGSKQQSEQKHGTQNGNSLSLSQRLEMPVQSNSSNDRKAQPDREEPQERIKTVKQLRDQKARRITQGNPMSVADVTSIPSQHTEKLRKQSLKDQALPARNQGTSLPNQSQKEKITQLPLEPSHRNQQQQKKNQTSPLVTKPVVVEMLDESRLSEPRTDNPNTSTVIQIRPKRDKQQNSLGIITQAIKSVQQRRQEDKKQQEKQKDYHSKSQDRIQKRDTSKLEWKKPEKQDKYSQEKNQQKQRDYKRENRHQDSKRDNKDNRDINMRIQKPERVQISSRWKEKEDYRTKEDERDRRKDQRDRKDDRDAKDQRERSRKKQDKYQRERERERGRKNDHHKNKDRSRDRDHNYRK